MQVQLYCLSCRSSITGSISESTDQVLENNGPWMERSQSRTVYHLSKT